MLQSTELKSHKAKLNSTQKALQDLESKNTELKKELSEINTKENSVNFLGININKILFFTINYTIIIALILSVIFLYKHYLFSSKNQANLIEALKVSEETINSNKKKGLNRELKLKREILELEKQLPKK